MTPAETLTAAADLRERVLHALRTTPVPGTPPGLGLPDHHRPGETGYFNWCALCTRDTQALADAVRAAINSAARPGTPRAAAAAEQRARRAP
ncbi:hypothetical protein [Streptomyces sp. NPDC060243]|uniref:hypothetical protein n=1 Tax=Streptomyces sp. NPDC060243 TaxID=3347081 RepID=UPI0036627A75